MTYDVLDVSRHVINYSNEKGYGISNLKLQKVLYFIQAYFLISKNDKCFNEKIEAWDIGPVIHKAYKEYKYFGCGDIPSIFSFIEYPEDEYWNPVVCEYKDNNISEEDKILIDKVIDKFANYSATDLVSITHRQSPWIRAFTPEMHNEITVEKIKEYFSSNV